MHDMQGMAKHDFLLRLKLWLQMSRQAHAVGRQGVGL